MLYQSGTDIRAIASSFKFLFEKSIRAWDEKEVPLIGHKFHFNVSAYSNYISKFLLGGLEYFVRFTIRKIGQDSSVHASTISEVAIYRKTEGTLADSHQENPEDGNRMPFIDNKIAFFLSACQWGKSNEKNDHLNQTISNQTIKQSSLLSRLHARMGDFWWYSLMIFMAARAADCLNVFVGLWLVPKYVPPSELGAVQPLTQFAAFLAIPISVFASTFRQELSRLAIGRQFGQLKTLMRGVFIAAAIFFFVAIVVSHFILPHFLERIRIVEGSLGMLVLVYSFINALLPVFQSALQALKKFKATTVISLFGAPIRLLAMLATLPLRALSGYFVGQASTPAFSIVTSIIALRKELSVPAEPYWDRSVIKRFSKLFLIFGIGAIIAGFSSLIETTVLRQRIPEIESAAYYMVTRFSDIANFVTMTLMFTIFPFTAELAAKGKDTRPLLLKAAGAISLTSIALAVFFWTFGRPILALLPNGAQYADYYWAIPWTIVIGMMSALTCLYCSVETSANRFGYMWWSWPVHLLYPVLLLLVTGNGYYADALPACVRSRIVSCNVTSLYSMFWWMTIFQFVKIPCCIVYELCRKRK